MNSITYIINHAASAVWWTAQQINRLPTRVEAAVSTIFSKFWRDPARVPARGILLTEQKKREDADLVQVFNRLRTSLISPDIQFPLLSDDSTRDAQAIRKWMGSHQDVLQGISSLDLIDLPITTVPAEIGLLNGLRTLRCQNTNITALPANFNLPNLRTLALNGTPINRLPDDLHLPNLTVLHLSDTQIGHLPDDLDLPNLTDLYLSNTQIDSLPDGLNLPNLKILALDYTPINRLPDDLRLLNLISLDLSNTQIDHLPNDLHLPNLVYFEIHRTPINCLPANLDLPKLTFLDLSNTKIDSLPDGLNLPDLASLHLYHTPINRLPDHLNLPNLISLNLSNTQIDHLPNDLHLPNLVYFELHRTPINRLPDNLDLPNLTYLDLRDTLIDPLPPHVGRLTRSPVDPIPGIYQFHPVPVAPQNQTLAEELQAWKTEFGQMYPEEQSPCDWSPLTSLDVATQKTLMNFLNNLEQGRGGLRQTADYQNPVTKKNIVLRVNQILRLACTNEEFRHTMLGITDEAANTCGDRAILFFADLEIQWHLHHKELTTQELVVLVPRIQRYEELKQVAKERAKAKGNENEEIQTILKYLIELKGPLNLPISIAKMLYTNHFVTEDMLSDAQNSIGEISDLDLLSRSEIWQKHLQKDRSVAAQFKTFEAELEAECNQRLGEVDPDLSDPQYLQKTTAIIQYKKQALCDFAKKLTTAYLRDNRELAPPAPQQYETKEP